MNNLRAKIILPDQFWILYNTENSKAGVCYVGDNCFYSIIDHQLSKYESSDEFFDKHNVIEFEETQKNQKIQYDVNGYPAKTEPFNSKSHNLNEVTHYIFTKKEKSKSYYCAGYYVVRFNFGWIAAFCPKLSTLEKNDFKGPYKTELEMKQKLKDSKNE